MGNALIPGGMDSHDIVAVDKDNPVYLRIKKKKEEMTGWERVQFAFRRDEVGDLTPEMHRIKDATFISMVVGGIMGGVGRSRIAYMDFFRNHNTAQYETPLQAKKVLQDKVTLGMGSGAFRLGWRISAFTFMYMTGATVIASYRGKYGFIDQVGGAGIAGFLYKIRDGPKAAFSGTVFGSLLGAVAGGLTLAAVNLSGMDMESANVEYYARLSRKLNAEKEVTRRARESEGEGDDGIKSLESFHQNLLSSMQPKKVQTEQKTLENTTISESVESNENLSPSKVKQT